MNLPHLLTMIVTNIELIAEGVKRMTLSLPDGSPLPSFSAGANLGLEFGSQTRRWRNNYTLVNDPDERRLYQVAVLRSELGRKGSLYIHDEMQIGEIAQVRPPYNLFSIDRSAKRHVLIAGGIGVTPIFAMARELKREGRAYELHYAARSREQAAFLSELRDDHFDVLSFYDASRGERLNLTELMRSQRVGTRVYVCGPNSMVQEARHFAKALHWPKHALLTEQFNATVVGDAFSVELAASAKMVSVPEGVTLLEALEEQGLAIASLCRMGACGFCQTRVVSIDGEIDHRDHILDASQRASQQVIYPCVSRFCGARLVLDL